MKAVKLYGPLWAGTGTGPAGMAVVGAVHGPAPAPLDQGQGPVSDPALRPEGSRSLGKCLHNNADIPPVVFPGGRNPYLDRPLPPPPSKTAAVATATASAASFIMQERPRTSSGPGSGKTAGTRPNFDKRLSKDDMALSGRMGMGKGRVLQPYVTGVNGPRALTREASPHRMQMASSSLSSLPAMLPTPGSSASGEMPIGMALGSPTRDSTQFGGSPYGGGPAGWKPQLSQTSVQISSSPPPPQAPEQQPIQRTKTQKRRLFGSLFGSKKHSEPPKAVETVKSKGSASSAAALGLGADAVAARTNTIKKTPKHKPIIITPTESPLKTTTHESGWPSVSNLAASTSTSGVGLLAVDIPDIRLERYSVMFSGVLNEREPKSTLLERRQATLEKLKTISDRIEIEEGRDRTRPRRATSPQPTKSPAFTLFPHTPVRQSILLAATEAGMVSTTSLAPPRGLTRSNTSPGYLPSPSRARFESGLQPDSTEPPARKEKKSVTIVSPRSMDERNRAAQVERLREQQQAQYRHQQRSQPQVTTDPANWGATTTTTFYFNQNESSLILDSPQSTATPSSSPSLSFSSESDDGSQHPRTTTHPLNPPLKPTLPEPQWEIITPPSSTSSSTDSTSSKHANPSSKRSASISDSTTASSVASRSSLDSILTPLAPSALGVSVDEEDAALKAAVEISIARQISISRQQRRLLRPFGQSGTTMSSGNGGSGRNVNGGGPRGRSATVGAATGTGKGQGEVTVGVIKGRVTPVMVGTEYRRSERVVLDAVE
ncbi:hypothetical protein C8A03DRAFT_38463 [Achaetomium macrosporum]|uniref:Uncharacterized protein n=1 Tax=Achaetomium macrosporum TaxID=79813 RepID=A0AAN7C225_9PEZI|nr:hypothetical protein C8A03DRAFT_38463 [Achaetomium macrosporum]